MKRYSFTLKNKLARQLWEAIPRPARGVFIENALIKSYEAGKLDCCIPPSRVIPIYQTWREFRRKKEVTPSKRCHLKLVTKEDLKKC